MKRRFVYNGILTLIGKKTRNLETQCLGVSKINEYADKVELKKKILTMTPEEARKKGVLYRSTLKRIKDKIRNRKDINWESKIISALVKH